MTTRLFAAVMAIAMCGLANAATINVPADYTTIQAAVDAASDGDEILVAPGTYTGTSDQVVDMLGKTITLRASGTPEQTIIDGEYVRQGIVCNSGETASTIIEGFTITGGHTNNNVLYGAGVYCYGSSPTVVDCTISGNHASRGGGIYLQSGSPSITNCTISNNTASYRGGGIFFHSSGGTLTNCTITSNTATGDGGGLLFEGNSDAALLDCEILSNTCGGRGGGIFCEEGSDVSLEGCEVASNAATSQDGGGIYADDSSDLEISNTAFTGNAAGERGGAICVGGTQGSDNPCSLYIGSCSFSNNAATIGGAVFVVAFDTNTAFISTSLICENEHPQLVGPWTDGGGNQIRDNCGLGGCCTANQTGCVMSTEEDCLYFGGTFAGYDIECIDAACPTSCLGDINTDGEVSTNDLLTVIANWGPCP